FSPIPKEREGTALAPCPEISPSSRDRVQIGVCLWMRTCSERLLQGLRLDCARAASFGETSRSGLQPGRRMGTRSLGGDRHSFRSASPLAAAQYKNSNQPQPDQPMGKCERCFCDAER